MTRVDTVGLQDAIDVATAALRGQSHYTADNWTLISAQRFPAKGCWVWRITFKPTEHLSKDPYQGYTTSGGEVFVRVDPVTRKTEIGYGE